MAVEDFISPFGYSGFSDPDANDLPPAEEPPIVLADDIDPNTGEFLSFDGVHPVDAHLRYQFQIEAGSGAAVGRTGHRFKDIKTIDERTQNNLTFEAKRILKLLGPEWVIPKKPDDDTQAIRTEVDPLTQLGAIVIDYENVLARKSGEVRRLLEG